VITEVTEVSLGSGDILGCDDTGGLANKGDILFVRIAHEAEPVCNISDC
jgi:hypothetical protein